jgi:hypothetical protein
MGLVGAWSKVGTVGRLRNTIVHLVRELLDYISSLGIMGHRGPL